MCSEKLLSRIRRDDDDAELLDNKLHRVGQPAGNVHHHPFHEMGRQENDAEWATGEWVPSKQILDEGEQ